MEGFVIPLHRSLTEPILLGGVPRNVAIIIGTFAAAIGLGLQLWFVGGAVMAAKKDPQFMDVLMRHIRHKSYLDA